MQQSNSHIHDEYEQKCKRPVKMRDPAAGVTDTEGVCVRGNVRDEYICKVGSVAGRSRL